MAKTRQELLGDLGDVLKELCDSFGNSFLFEELKFSFGCDGEQSLLIRRLDGMEITRFSISYKFDEVGGRVVFIGEDLDALVSVRDLWDDVDIHFKPDREEL